MRLYLLLTSCALLFSSYSAMPVGVLELNISNIEHDYGTLWIGVYPTAASFLNKEDAILYSLKDPKKHKDALRINNLDYGDYAIALFHDLNDNGTLDVNWLGVPTEPYAFSKPLQSKWRVPSFWDVRINLFQSQKTIHTQLNTWWEQ